MMGRSFTGLARSLRSRSGRVIFFAMQLLLRYTVSVAVVGPWTLSPQGEWRFKFCAVHSWAEGGCVVNSLTLGIHGFMIVKK